MTRLFGVAMAAVLLSLSGCAANARAPKANTLEDDLALMMAWFPGEYDNYEQVWQQEVDGLKPEERHEHIHHIFLPVDAPAFEGEIYFVKQYMDGDYDDVYRQRMYQFTTDDAEGAIRLTIYRFLDEQKYRYADQNPELMKALTVEEVKTSPGCEVYWKLSGEHFDGYMHDTCGFTSPQSGQWIRITDSLKLTNNAIWIGDKAFDEQGNKVFGRDEQHVNRKVRYFTGWFGLKATELDPKADPEAWIFGSGLRLHNEGQIIPLVGKDGTDTGYSIQLAQLTYQNTTNPILKLGLIENATGKTKRYIWADTEAKQIGMNLRWVQVGLTEE